MQQISDLSVLLRSQLGQLGGINLQVLLRDAGCRRQNAPPFRVHAWCFRLNLA